MPYTLYSTLILLSLTTFASPVFAEDIPSSPLARCIAGTQSWYNTAVSTCLNEVSASISATIQSDLAALASSSIPQISAGSLTADELQKKFLERSQQGSAEIQKKQQDCYGGALLSEYKSRTAACYRDNPLGGVWDLPVLKQALENQLDGWQALTPDQSLALTSCLTQVSETHDLQQVSAEIQSAISACFMSVGLKGLGNLYAAVATTVDCAKQKLSFTTAADVARVATAATADERDYINECIIKRTAPVVTGVAALNIPLVAGWHNVWLFGQLIVTQPLLLIRRRKYKTAGKVFDAVTREPVDLGTVRLLQEDTKKVISTVVTGRTGAYFFLPPPGTYRVEVDKAGYQFPSAMLAKSEHDRDTYLGGAIPVDKKEQVIDRHIPIDPALTAVSIRWFQLRAWRYRLALGVGTVAPLLSLIAFAVTRTWWMGVLTLVHLLLFVIFIRLSRQKKTRKFGVVTGSNKENVSGAIVSLFRKGDNKLVGYYVTDLFGRYFFPIIVGDFLLTFEKKGYSKKVVPLTVRTADDAHTIKVDVTLEK